MGLVRARRDMSLLVEIETGVRLARYAPGRIEFEPSDAAPPDLAARLAQRLQLWTGARWGVAVVGSGGAATIAEVSAPEKGDFRARRSSIRWCRRRSRRFRAPRTRAPRPADAPEAAQAPAAEADDEDDWHPF